MPKIIIIYLIQNITTLVKFQKACKQSQRLSENKFVKPKIQYGYFHHNWRCHNVWSSFNNYVSQQAD